MADQVNTADQATSNDDATGAVDADTTTTEVVDTPDPVKDEGPVQLPDDHPLVTALAAQKTKIADLQSQVAQAKQNADGQVPAQVADALRTHLIAVHKLDEATAAKLITGTTPEQVIDQVEAVVGLTGRPADAPLMGTTEPTPPNEEAAFAAAVFGGGDS